jgi:xanthine dehydrogenase molybdenum-binding subunit
MTLRFTLNGEAREIESAPDESLLEVLRTRCGVFSTKDGCQPQGQCGCCLALVNGAPKVTCAVPAEKVEGREVLTLEGVDRGEREMLARAFVAATGLQCGFCIPGIALRAKYLVDRNPHPDRADIVHALHGHLCRCTGYVKIVDAIDLYAKARRGEPVPGPCENGRVGESLARYEGMESTLGMRPYVDDLVFPGMLHGAVVLSPHARSLVRRIDTTRAANHPAVVKVATWKDVPGERWYGLLYADWPGFVAEGEEARCVGDVLAVVVAHSEHEAREAAALVDVDFEVRDPVLDPEAALQDGAPRVNPRHENILSKSVIRRGDARAALRTSAHVVRGTWATQRIEHLYLEPESAVAHPRADGKMHLYSQGQGVFDDRRQCASFLGVAEDDIFVELVPNGGAFGGKEDLSIQAHAVLLAKLTGRPVKITLSREESIRLHPKRHPITMHYEVGCDEEGRLTAVHARMISDSGAYASVGSKVLERAAGHACGPYSVPHVDIESLAVYTNHPPAARCAGSDRTKRSSPWKGVWISWPKKRGSILGRFDGETRSSRDPCSRPGKFWRSRSGSRKLCSRSRAPMTRRSGKDARSASGAD